ncbi:inositol polyphosphate multikinase isoform X2 [Conger conger]|uniref:inositol polyphosphate multikinase isoform X2 n=1 Tax=Conger conger TaxID=82655 RepID=UPI002A5A2E34|nr:inositol polyphosphate multikinase isoform X2 [Conger conger]
MSTVKMSTQHEIGLMDSSLALGKLEINSPGSLDISHSVTKKGKTVQDGPQTHLNGCVPLSHQVAGHKYGVDKVGILQHPDGTVLKQLQPPPRGPREMQFYSQVYAEDCSDPVLLELQQYLPKYFGAWSSPDTPAELYLKLEDVTRKFQKPCIMDVKIGQRSYDPFASQEKREQQIKKYPLMEEMGFLVLGMRIYKVNSDSYETHDQHYGRGLVKETIKDGEVLLPLLVQVLLQRERPEERCSQRRYPKSGEDPPVVRGSEAVTFLCKLPAVCVRGLSPGGRSQDGRQQSAGGDPAPQSPGAERQRGGGVQQQHPRDWPRGERPPPGAPGTEPVRHVRPAPAGLRPGSPRRHPRRRPQRPAGPTVEVHYPEPPGAAQRQRRPSPAGRGGRGTPGAGPGRGRGSPDDRLRPRLPQPDPG